MTEQAVQIVGAILILVGFVLSQLRRLAQDSYPYLLANLAGAIILTVDAWRGRQWGFVLLEGVWSLVSLWGVVPSIR
jgi:protein-S-isoprenylcysteine O-methyltransferase Ste14